MFKHSHSAAHTAVYCAALFFLSLTLGGCGSEAAKQEAWQREVNRRIALDFNKTEQDIRQYLADYYPQLTDSMLRAWENAKSLEFTTIDGEKRYFHNAARNLFRIDSNARKVYEAKNGHTPGPEDTLLWSYIPRVEAMASLEMPRVMPQRFRITYTITVPEGTVPEGEIIRCWMPLPRTDQPRHSDFRLIKTNCPNYTIAPDSCTHKSLYMEAPAQTGQPTVFREEFEFTAYAQYHPFQPGIMPAYNPQDSIYLEFTREKLPHICFDPLLTALADSICAGAKTPYAKVKRIFRHIVKHYPWASAREYSTLDCIPLYVLENRHGDCGQVALLFISMCRAQGIPARWQSGWMLHPNAVNLHDWAEVYYPGMGWTPVDVSFGRTEWPSANFKETHPQEWWFFSRGIDAYRLIVNNGISGSFFPTKKFPRSETVDFQRGELEWKGGNLYFDQWDYQMDVEYL